MRKILRYCLIVSVLVSAVIAGIYTTYTAKPRVLADSGSPATMSMTATFGASYLDLAIRINSDEHVGGCDFDVSYNQTYFEHPSLKKSIIINAVNIKENTNHDSVMVDYFDAANVENDDSFELCTIRFNLTTAGLNSNINSEFNIQPIEFLNSTGDDIDVTCQSLTIDRTVTEIQHNVNGR